MGYAGEGQVDDVVDAAQAEVYDVTDKRTSEDYAPLCDIMESTSTRSRRSTTARPAWSASPPDSPTSTS